MEVRRKNARLVLLTLAFICFAYSISASVASGTIKKKVRPGDTLSGIAEDYDVDMEEIIKANNLSGFDPKKLQAGQILVIPNPFRNENQIAKRENARLKKKNRILKKKMKIERKRSAKKHERTKRRLEISRLRLKKLEKIRARTGVIKKYFKEIISTLALMIIALVIYIFFPKQPVVIAPAKPPRENRNMPDEDIEEKKRISNEPETTKHKAKVNIDARIQELKRKLEQSRTENRRLKDENKKLRIRNKKTAV